VRDVKKFSKIEEEKSPDKLSLSNESRQNSTRGIDDWGGHRLQVTKNFLAEKTAKHCT
jgi:hypothetical protein